jgi:hypothetical protein
MGGYEEPEPAELANRAFALPHSPAQPHSMQLPAQLSNEQKLVTWHLRTRVTPLNLPWGVSLILKDASPQSLSNNRTGMGYLD